ncbi:hypothetical protein NNJEOMEG_03652 [Fundidesulfovibrio magnetotacticus]|uniref:Uncharacterized protein n=1 Tax=Fundidesulfovibrio magnetotacticus TaxID=2730080 RepID=A0A6V8LVL1_9BACT|nr:hypothetical protein NNJEOMEG_03652 [Fundidesulfovibrio magnetotacticus]
MYGAEKKPDGSPRLYSLSPHEDEDVYAIARKPGRSEGTAVEPMIDPVDAVAEGMAGGGLAALRATGTPLRRAGVGIATGSADVAKNVAEQYANSTFKTWFK